MEESAQSLQSDQSEPPQPRTVLPVILLAAVVQGWSLYGLHESVVGNHWPATDNAWLVALYAVAVFVPLTMQLLARHFQRAAAWIAIAAITAAYGYFGWNFGRHVVGNSTQLSSSGGPPYFEVCFTLAVLWLLMLPFLQGRLETGRWRVSYASLFRTAWRNKLMLAEAGVFTGLFWLLLFLWQKLFLMLGISFFLDLFEEPIFIYPVTALTFGLALHLIGTIDQLTSVVLEQILNVLKWLGLVAATLLVFFTIALLLRTPELVFTGRHAISATWLLWLTAVIVLLINAAYRDGSVERPYPRTPAKLLRLVIPLLVVIAITALYALVIRANHYGITVSRQWAFVVAGTALVYAVGYSIAAAVPGPWLVAIARVNVAVAIGLILIIVVMLTPLLSPYRLAAASQFERVLAGPVEQPSGRGISADTPYMYLRFGSGQYGLEALRRLSVLRDNPRAEQIRSAASAALAQNNRWQPGPLPDLDEKIKHLAIYPAGRTLDAALIQALKRTYDPASRTFPVRPLNGAQSAGLFVDLDGDGSDEFVLLEDFGGTVYSLRNSAWKRVGNLTLQQPVRRKRSWTEVLEQLRRQQTAVTRPQWMNLSIGDRVFRLNPDEE